MEDRYGVDHILITSCLEVRYGAQEVAARAAVAASWGKGCVVRAVMRYDHEVARIGFGRPEAADVGCLSSYILILAWY